MKIPEEKEIKPCWKCGAPLTINEYGYATCYNTSKHTDGYEAHVFGDKRGTYKNAYDEKALSYQQRYYREITKKKRMLVKQ